MSGLMENSFRIKVNLHSQITTSKQNTRIFYFDQFFKQGKLKVPKNAYQKS